MWPLSDTSQWPPPTPSPWGWWAARSREGAPQNATWPEAGMVAARVGQQAASPPTRTLRWGQQDTSRVWQGAHTPSPVPSPCAGAALSRSIVPRCERGVEPCRDGAGPHPHPSTTRVEGVVPALGPAPSQGSPRCRCCSPGSRAVSPGAGSTIQWPEPQRGLLAPACRHGHKTGGAGRGEHRSSPKHTWRERAGGLREDTSHTRRGRGFLLSRCSQTHSVASARGASAPWLQPEPQGFTAAAKTCLACPLPPPPHTKSRPSAAPSVPVSAPNPTSVLQVPAPHVPACPHTTTRCCTLVPTGYM